MSGMFTTVNVAVVAERIVRYYIDEAELDLDLVVRVKEGLAATAQELHLDWDLERLTIVEAALLRHWYLNAYPHIDPQGA